MQLDSKVEEVTCTAPRSIHQTNVQARIREAVLRAVYRHEGYELPRLDVYLPSTEGIVEEGHCCRVSSLRYAASCASHEQR